MPITVRQPIAHLRQRAANEKAIPVGAAVLIFEFDF
jgi:hypothetical protein